MVQNGGFYWAGAYVCRDYVLVGTDDGKSGYTSKTANVLLLDPMSGKLLDSMTGFAGDIRSTICYDEATNAFYFDSKGSYFYRVRVQKDTDGARLRPSLQMAAPISVSAAADSSRNTPAIALQ